MTDDAFVPDPPKWNGTYIARLSNDALQEAKAKISEMENYRLDKLDNKKERHKKIDFSTINPAFEEIKTTIDKEITKRGL